MTAKNITNVTQIGVHPIPPCYAGRYLMLDLDWPWADGWKSMVSVVSVKETVQGLHLQVPPPFSRPWKSFKKLLVHCKDLSCKLSNRKLGLQYGLTTNELLVPHLPRARGRGCFSYSRNTHPFVGLEHGKLKP